MSVFRWEIHSNLTVWRRLVWALCTFVGKDCCGRVLSRYIHSKWCGFTDYITVSILAVQKQASTGFNSTWYLLSAVSVRLLRSPELTLASSQRSCWAGPPDSPPCQTRVWSRGGLGSGSCPPRACRSAATSQRRASPLMGWGLTGSPRGGDEWQTDTCKG